ncbi:MAG: GTPase HflX [Lachnospiraceae bacterium]|nr:GTPase HflX [Lachnospiraceae bacterium]
MTEITNTTNEVIKAILVGLNTPDREKEGTVSDFDHSMTEMKSLVEACDLEVAGIVTQSLEHPESGTYIGKGKAYEIADTIRDTGAEYCIFEGNLSPAQMKNLQRIVEVPVWDRTNLILEIFSRRAKTREAKLQVESAYLHFMLPRLTGMWQHLGRQGGGSGSRSNKGIGETQIELDRRHINHRLAELSKELDTISKTRKVQRLGRQSGMLPTVALVGYTNAGKSSLMNRLISLSEKVTKRNPEDTEEKKVFEKDMLFATLDTSVRRIYTGDKKDFLLSDTVGFIENLPHGLVKAFRSTLEEIKYAQLLLIVLDASDPYHKQHRLVTEKTLAELEPLDIPRIYVMNKADLLESKEASVMSVAEGIQGNAVTVYISAKTGEGIDELLKRINEVLHKGEKKMEVLIPFSKGELLGRLHTSGAVISEEYTEDGTLATIDCPVYMKDELAEYLKSGAVE